MTAAAHVRAAIAELDVETRELTERLEEVAGQRAALEAWLGHVGNGEVKLVARLDGDDIVIEASPRDTPDPALPAGPTATAGVPVPSDGPPATPARTPAAKPVMSRDGHRSAPVKKGAPGTGPDLADVARLARDAKAAGKPIRRTVATALGLSPSTTTQYLIAARNAGHDVPYERVPAGKPKPAAPPPVVRGTPKDQPSPHLPAPPTAPPTAWSLTDPRPAPAAWTPKPGENVVRCQENGCDFVQPITRLSLLRSHCNAVHGRPPTRQETLPEEWEG